MKTNAAIVILFLGILAVSGCKKEGMNGNKSIIGTVYFHDGVSAIDAIAPQATIFITYDSKTYTGKVDETVTSDAKGDYSIKGLKKGEYFVSGEYITSHGFKYTTPGHGVIIDRDDDKISLNIRLY